MAVPETTGLYINKSNNPFVKKDEQKAGNSVSEKQAAAEIVLYGENATPVSKTPANKGNNIGLVSQDALSADDNMGLGIERTTTNVLAEKPKPTQEQKSTYTDLDSYIIGETSSRAGATVEKMASSAAKNVKLSSVVKFGGKALGHAGSIVDASMVVKDVVNGEKSLKEGLNEARYVSTDVVLGAIPVVGTSLSFVGSKNIENESKEYVNDVSDDIKKGDYNNLISRGISTVKSITSPTSIMTGGALGSVMVGAAGRKISSLIGSIDEKAGETYGKYVDLYAKSLGGDNKAKNELQTMAINGAKEVIKSTTESAKKVAKNTAKTVLSDETYKTASQTYNTAKKEVKEGNYANATKTVVKGVAKTVLPDKTYDTVKEAYNTVKNWF